MSFTLHSFYSLFWPQLPGSPCDVSPLHMPLKWIRCCLRHCSRRDMTEQEHDAAGLCNILWKAAEQRYCSSGKGWALQKLFAANVQSIFLWAVVPIKPNMKCWEWRSLFPDYKQWQAQMFPVAVTQENLLQKRGCGCYYHLTYSCHIHGRIPSQYAI